LKDLPTLYEGIKKIDIADFWKIKTDIVIPAAMELQITEEIAKKMDCRLIVEGIYMDPLFWRLIIFYFTL
jgi:glutamate dehydrogenase/leucine dehydrogenase